MDTVMLDLNTIVRKVVEDYADGDWWKARSFAVCDEDRRAYAAIVVPDHPRKYKAGLVVMARVVGDTVVIEHDTTDRPLWEELVRLGVPREKIILTYTGDPVPDVQPE